MGMEQSRGAEPPFGGTPSTSADGVKTALLTGPEHNDSEFGGR
jgi:hypothetical protein